MRVGIYGGSFNPPHTGHVKAAATAAKQLALNLLVVIPVGVPPHKTMPEGSPAADLRLQMAQNSFGNMPNTIVLDIEAKNPEPSYTSETILAIKGMYPGAQLILLLGTDMYLSLETWKDHEALLNTITPAVFSRDAGDISEITVQSKYLKEKYDVKTEIIHNDAVEISSSELRKSLPLRGGIGYIKDTNYSYIISGRLYGAKPDWNWLREKAYAMLNPKRVPHVAACEAAAIKLAERWGVNPDDAREAAVLHDITKKFDLKAHIKALEDNGEKISAAITPNEEKLLHAKSGAVLAGALFGASEQVVDAIRWHTTGRTNMTMLAKVLYLADYIESTRNFEGVEKLRDLAYENIDEAMILGLEMTVSDVQSRGIVPDRATLDAINYLKGSYLD